MDFMTAIMGAGGAAVIAASAYLKARGAGEPLEPAKFIQTVVIGAISGFALGMTGIKITDQNVEVQMAAYAFLGGGIAIVIENVGKYLYRPKVPVTTVGSPVIVTPAVPGGSFKMGFKVLPAFAKGVSPYKAQFHTETTIVQPDHPGVKSIRIDWMDGSPLETFTPDSRGFLDISHVYTYSAAGTQYDAHSFYPEFTVISNTGAEESFNTSGRDCEVECQSIIKA
jgi:hypothetical protein